VWRDPGNDAIVEEALRFGWVDSAPRTRDDAWAMLRISPCKARSAWSKPRWDRAARGSASRVTVAVMRVRRRA